MIPDDGPGPRGPIALSAPAPAAVRAAERRVVLGYVAPGARGGFAALLALDDLLAGIVRTTREPIVGQMRLTWWHDALSAADRAAPPAEPVLAALVSDVLPRGVSGRALAVMIDAWEALLDPAPLDPAAFLTFARQRGGALFEALGRVLGPPAAAVPAAAGEGWALADLAFHLRDPAQSATARTLATDRLACAFDRRWPSAVRPIGMLALLARADLAAAPPRPGSPARLARLLMHRIWGR